MSCRPAFFFNFASIVGRGCLSKLLLDKHTNLKKKTTTKPNHQHILSNTTMQAVWGNAPKHVKGI